MGRHLLLALLIAGLGICASSTLADSPAASTQSAPATATATHALAATTAPSATTAAEATPSKSPAVAPAATTATPAPAVTAPTAASAAPAQTTSGPSMPVRGMSMANVEHIFGAPQEKIPAVPDPGTKLHPPITRWVYPDYVVYFEYNYVVHTVLKDHPFTDSNPSGG